MVRGTWKHTLRIRVCAVESQTEKIPLSLIHSFLCRVLKNESADDNFQTDRCGETLWAPDSRTDATHCRTAAGEAQDILAENGSQARQISIAVRCPECANAAKVTA